MVSLGGRILKFGIICLLCASAGLTGAARAETAQEPEDREAQAAGVVPEADNRAASPTVGLDEVDDDEAASVETDPAKESESVDAPGDAPVQWAENAEKAGGEAAGEAGAAERGGVFKINGLLELMYLNNRKIKYDSANPGSYYKSGSDRLTPNVEIDPSYKCEDFSFNGKIQYNFDRGCFKVLDCKFTVPLDEGLLFSGGRMKTPFGIEKLQASYKTLTVNSSELSDALYLGRGWGFNFQADTSKDSKLLLGIINDSRHHHFVSRDYYLNARSTFKLDKYSQLGFSAVYGKHYKDDGYYLPAGRFGLDYQHIDDRLRLDAEIIYGTGYNKKSGRDSEALGAYVGGAYTLNDNLDAVLFLDWFDPDLRECEKVFYDNSRNGKARLAVGANYYFDREPVRRLMVNYEWKLPTEGPCHSEQGFYVKYTYRF